MYVLSPPTLLCDTLYQKMLLSDLNLRLIYIPFMKRSFTNCYKYVLWIMNECISCQTFFWYTANSYKKLQKNSMIRMVKTYTCSTRKLYNYYIYHNCNKMWIQRFHVIVVEKKNCSVVPVWYTLYMTFYGDTHRVT